MGFFITALFFVGNFLLQKLLTPRVRQSPQHAKAASLSDFDIITATEGRALPILFGTRLLRAPNLGWYGDFSTTPIVESGVTTGYKYFLGSQAFLCHGEAEVLAVRFREKNVGAIIGEGDNGFVISKTGAAPWKTALLPVDNYSDGADIALALEGAIKEADPGEWRCTFGFSIRAGVNDYLKVRLDSTTKEWTIPPGDYTGDSLAAYITGLLNQFNTSKGGRSYDWLGTYNEITGLFGITLQEIPLPTLPQQFWQFVIYKTSTVLSTIGRQFETDDNQIDVVTPSLSSNYAVFIDRFIVGYGGTTAALRLTDAASTLAPILGFDTLSDATGLGITTSASDFVIIGATITDQGDFIQYDIDDPNFFGTEGGLSGRLDVYKGKLTQAESSYMTTELGETAPAYHGIAHAVARGMYVGNSTFPPPPSYLLRRLPNTLGLTGDGHNVGGDANPAAIIYEALTDTRWGRGWPTGVFDLTAFRAAGDQLAAEGFGLSLLLESPEPTEEFIAEILRHIDAMLYTDPMSGLVTLRLIRDDYDPAAIPVIDEDKALQIRVSRGSWDQTRNVVKVRYISREHNWTERIEQVQELANIQARDGEMAIEDIAFPGISNAENALAAAERTLRVVAAHIAQVSIAMNREEWSLRPGDPFLLNFPSGGIVGMPCRAVRVEMGPLEDGEILIDAIQDVTDMPWPDNGGDLSGWGVTWGYDWNGEAA